MCVLSIEVAAQDSRLKTQKYLFDHYLHFLKFHIINNCINTLHIDKFLFICAVSFRFIYTCDHDLSGQYILLIPLIIYSVYQIANYPRHIGFLVEVSDKCVCLEH